MKTALLRPRLLATAIALAGLAVPAQALTILFRDITTGGAMSASQLAAFQAAGAYWQSQFTDNVTVFLDIGFDNLGTNVLGSTGTAIKVTSYTSVRSSLTTDAKSALDGSAVGNLQAGSALSFLATLGDGVSSRFDNDGSANNAQLAMTTANAKALGIATSTTTASKPDATIMFANAFANDFVYTRAGGTPGNKIDFITVAEHEIGHALGFISGVDDIDYCAGANNQCNLPNTNGRFETSAWYGPLDLFRYSAAGVLDLRVGGSPYFSTDGGVTSIDSFSTGAELGNGWQASHFGPGVINLMRPFVSRGVAYDATVRDLAAFDAIGWDLTAAVPEPRSYAMLLAGLGVVLLTAHRRRR